MIITMRVVIQSIEYLSFSLENESEESRTTPASSLLFLKKLDYLGNTSDIKASGICAGDQREHLIRKEI
jgi:hypothetical protein